MDKNPFMKYVMKGNKKEDIFHSSAYGKAQNGAGMGVASTESFAKRRAVDLNRRVVRGYGESGVVNNSRAQGPKAKPYTPISPEKYKA